MPTEVTELTELSAEKVSGVGAPANGTPWLLLKAASDSSSDEAEEIERLLTKELAGYCGDESCPSCAAGFDRLPAALLEKAKLKAKQRHALPDSAFAYIDSDGGRHLPIHDASHVRAAIARFNQTSFDSDAAKHEAAKKIMSAAKSFGIHVGSDDNVAEMAKKGRVEKSPGVPSFSVEMPTEGGHLRTGQSGLSGPATGGVRPSFSDPSFVPGGQSSYEIPSEQKANAAQYRNPPAPAPMDDPGTGDKPVAAKEAGWTIETDRPLRKQNWVTLDAPTVAESADPGNPSWEGYDAASLDSVARGLAGAKRAIEEIKCREMVEAISGDPSDWFDAWKLECAADDICCALGLVATLAYHEAAEGEAKKVGRTISAKTGARLRAARDHLSDLLGEGSTASTAGNGARASLEEDQMTTITKEELEKFVADSSKKVARQAMKAEAKKARKALKKEMKRQAKKNANNGGDITAAQERRAVSGVADANDVNSVPNGGHIDGEYVNKGKKVKKEKAMKSIRAQLSETRELVQKMASRPRSFGPVLDGVSRAGFPAGAPEGVEKSAGDQKIESLQKALGDATDPQSRDQISRELTLAQLVRAHESGLA